MVHQYRRVWAEIDLDAALNNIKEIRRITNKDARIMAIVKADGYGHGSLELARVFLKNGADYLAVAIIDEAEQLRLEGIDCPILILGSTHVSGLENVVKYDIIQSVFTFEMAKAISNEAVAQNKRAKIHIKVDTGMGRIGFLPSEQAVETIKQINMLPNIEIEGIFTHFATADESDKTYTNTQFEIFTRMIGDLEQIGIDIPVRHCANSAAIIDCPNMHLNMVRPGIILYGLYPSDEICKDRIDLKPLMRLKASIMHIKEVEEGASISYGRTFRTKRKSRIATIPVGYADGYSRLLSSKGIVEVDGHLSPVVGRICMDQFMIDVTDCGDVNVGDEVTLFGPDNGDTSVTADKIAEMIGTINYEVVCMISKRIPRVYVRNKQITKVINYIL